jgi:NAD(P)-dependent dehydrogenase (short-subunit alcohol dehydrogenase family)
VNHLAPFLLTACLAPRLSENAPGRVVTTSSEVHRRGDCSDLDAVIAGADYDALDAYADSKLANVAFTWELAARLADDGVSAAAFQPGGSRRQGCFVTPRCRPGCSSPWPDSRRASRLSARSRPRRPRARTSPTWSRTMTSNPAPPVYVDRRTVTAPAAGATDEPLHSRLWTRSAELVGVSAEVPAVDPLD